MLTHSIFGRAIDVPLVGVVLNLRSYGSKDALVQAVIGRGVRCLLKPSPPRIPIPPAADSQMLWIIECETNGNRAHYDEFANEQANHAASNNNNNNNNNTTSAVEQEDILLPPLPDSESEKIPPLKPQSCPPPPPPPAPTPSTDETQPPKKRRRAALSNIAFLNCSPQPPSTMDTQYDAQHSIFRCSSKLTDNDHQNENLQRAYQAQQALESAFSQPQLSSTTPVNAETQLLAQLVYQVFTTRRHCRRSQQQQQQQPVLLVRVSRMRASFLAAIVYKTRRHTCSRLFPAGDARVYLCKQLTTNQQLHFLLARKYGIVLKTCTAATESSDDPLFVFRHHGEEAT